ncbi:MAG: glycosyltransferase family 39 protein [Chloroflexi bacterium]|nr:glycosyltransferase family 39 protein [Chloroflexota bacterium]
MFVAADAAPLDNRPPDDGRSAARQQDDRPPWRRRHGRRCWPDLALVTLLVLLAGLARLPNLGLYTISFPEGIRAAQLQLMGAGYEPCVEIFCNQGPLLFYALYPTYALLGGTLEAVRSGVVLFSLLGLVATYWVGHLLGGRVSAVIATALVALSPTYLKFSRLALAEVPATAPAIAAVGAALVYQRTGRTRWLVLAALLTALSLLLKPVTLAVCVPVGLAVLLRAERRWRNLLLLVVVTGMAIAIPTILIGFSEILEQVVAFRLRSRTAEGRGIGWNWGRIVEELSGDRPGLFGFMLAGTIVALARVRRDLIPLLAWAPASLLLLLVHTPLHGKHIVTLIPPAALLAGVGAAYAWAALPTRAASVVLRDGRAPTSPAAARRLADPPISPRLGQALAVLVALGLATYVVFLPAVAQRDADLMFDPDPLENDPPSYWYPEVAATLHDLTDPADKIVTDHPYLTFRAGRLVPPPLVESSVTRVVAGSLTPEDAIAEATRYDAKAVLLWADKLTTMREFKTWVDRTFVPVRAYAADGEAIPTLYVAGDYVARARAVIAPLAPHRVDADYDGGIRLVSYGVDATRVPAGGLTSVTVDLLAREKPAVSYQAVFQLRGADGVDIWKSDELAIGGLGPGAANWSAGRAMSLSALVRPNRAAAPGEYSLSVRLYDPRAKRFVDSTLTGVEPGRPDPKGVTLTTLTVLPAESR